MKLSYRYLYFRLMPIYKYMDQLCIILLDPNNQYPPNDSQYGSQIFHFINRDICIDYIRNNITQFRHLDLFLSPTDRDFIDNYLPLFNNIYFHLYCPDDGDISRYESIYPLRERVEVFEKLYVWMGIGITISKRLFTSLNTINDRNQVIEMFRTTNKILSDEIEDVKAGVQPD